MKDLIRKDELPETKSGERESNAKERVKTRDSSTIKSVYIIKTFTRTITETTTTTTTKTASVVPHLPTIPPLLVVIVALPSIVIVALPSIVILANLKEITTHCWRRLRVRQTLPVLDHLEF